MRVTNYQSRIQEYTEGKDPLQMLQDAPNNLARAVRDISDEQLRRRPTSTRWSVLEIVAHIADVEIAAAWRYRQMLEHDGCQLGSFDQNRWASVGNYESWEVRSVLDLFGLLRTANLHVLLKLNATQWKNHGLHPEHGKLTIREFARHMAGHDINHLRQISRIHHNEKN